MRNEVTAVVERDGKWFVAYCPEIPGANGQGSTNVECLDSLGRLRRHGCQLKRQGRSHSLRTIPANGSVEAVSRHTGIADRLASKICRGLGVPEIG